MNIVVLGAGLVGGPMARDLADDRENAVTVADISQNALQHTWPRATASKRCGQT